MTLEELKQTTQDFWNVDITPKDRTFPRIKIRFLYYHTAYKIFPTLTLTELGHTLGQSHCTVLHAIREFPNIVNSDKNFKSDVVVYYKLIDSLIKDVDLKIEDYDDINNIRLKMMNVSANKKIKELRKRVSILEERLARYGKS